MLPWAHFLSLFLVSLSKFVSIHSLLCAFTRVNRICECVRLQHFLLLLLCVRVLILQLLLPMNTHGERRGGGLRSQAKRSWHNFQFVHTLSRKEEGKEAKWWKKKGTRENRWDADGCRDVEIPKEKRERRSLVFLCIYLLFDVPRTPQNNTGRGSSDQCKWCWWSSTVAMAGSVIKDAEEAREREKERHSISISLSWWGAVFLMIVSAMCDDVTSCEGQEKATRCVTDAPMDQVRIQTLFTRPDLRPLNVWQTCTNNDSF